jgi:hypothetical protein
MGLKPLSVIFPNPPTDWEKEEKTLERKVRKDKTSKAGILRQERQE